MVRAIDARRKGDEYQARVFWLYLLQLRTGNYVESVTLESDGVSFVDDVKVSYCKPIRDRVTGEVGIVCEYFQCKYHMTQSGAFTHKNLIDPKFIGCERSMLERLYGDYRSLLDELGSRAFRLYVFSNWTWDYRDELGKHLHEEMFRPSFYEKSEKSLRGKIRSKFADRLSISQKELHSFLDVVRFRLGKNLTDLARDLEPRLKLAGLQPIDPSATSVKYDDLAWKLFGQRRNRFDRGSFDEMIREEKLIMPASSEHSEISIQSFAQYAQRPHDLQAGHLDLCHMFDGRFAQKPSYWKKEIPEGIVSFLLNEDLQELPPPIHFFFDCHLSIAFFAGHLISPKHRLEIAPTQMRGSAYEVWLRPSGASEQESWNMELLGTIDKEVVVDVSVTHCIREDVDMFLEEREMEDLPRILLWPTSGLGANAIHDGDHAWWLGVEAMAKLRQTIPASCQTMHFFYAGPVALAYILGHTLRYVTRTTQLYEYDFEGGTYASRYYPSISIPINSG